MTAPPVRTHRTRSIAIVIVATVAAMAIIQAASGYQEDDVTAAAASTGSSVVRSPERQARDGDFTFVIEKVSRADRVGTDVLSMTAQGEFVLVNVAVTNHSRRAQSMFGDNQYLFDRSGRKYAPDNEAGLYLGNAGSAYDEITPGTTMAGVVVFDVPKNVKPARIELHDSAFSAGTTVTLT